MKYTVRRAGSLLKTNDFGEACTYIQQYFKRLGVNPTMEDSKQNAIRYFAKINDTNVVLTLLTN